jgi:hypothetical protein
MFARALAVTLIVCLGTSAAVAGFKKPAEVSLIGTWLLNGRPFAIFNPDGTGLMEEGSFRWSADGKELVITDKEGVQRLPYQVDETRLVIVIEEARLVLDRQPAAAPSRQPNGALTPPLPGPEPGPGAKPGQDPLAQLLLSSAWCSFSYNTVSGTSSTSRAQFFPDGTWSSGSRGETYSSGYGGTVAGQHDSGSGGHWSVQNGQLFMSNPPEVPTLSPVPLTVTRNSSGYPIITADGKEYSSCE